MTLTRGADPVTGVLGTGPSLISARDLLTAPAGGTQGVPLAPAPKGDKAGNTLATALNIGTLTGSKSFSEWVGSTDTNDYYSFNLSQASDFTLGLSGLTADANVELLNSTGAVLASSANTGTAAEAISQPLAAGTYHVRVFPYGGNTNYKLNLTGTPIDNAGNTLAAARNIGSLTSAQSFTDWVGSTDTNDYYSFNLSQASDFTLGLSGLSANADVQLLSSAGSILARSANTGTAAEAISRTLPAGSYSIRVFPSSGNTNYNLTVAATPPAPPQDSAGNTPLTARQIGLLTTGQTFTDWVGSADSDDYYSFDLAQNSSFNLSLHGLSANADVQLLSSSGALLASSSNTGTTAETISTSLASGTYVVRVYSLSGDTNYNLTIAATTTTNDWFSQNLTDASLISLTSSLAQDGNLSRPDMISLLRDAKDNGVVDANELTDLRTLVSNATRFGMTDAVRVLSSKVVNGDAANPRSGFGNLFAGSSDIQMENLIGKWFLGTDRPDLTSTSYTYSNTSGSLFQSGISANDVQQNALGDCYYLATLSSMALEQPSTIQNMFTDNGDNTFTVRFYNSGVADYVTVDRWLPTYSPGGSAVYAGWGGGAATSTSNELWVALAEKAYAQLAGSGWSRTYSGTQVNAYAAIEGGWMDTVIRQVMGVAASSSSVTNMTEAQLINLVNSNKVLTAGFVYGGGYGVYDSHAYTITSYNTQNGTFHLRNPWGTSDADVTWSQLLTLKAIVQWSN